jgi:hypothetical protein
VKRYQINGEIFEAVNKLEAAKLFAKSIGFAGYKHTKVLSLGRGWYKLTYPDFGSSRLTITEVKEREQPRN